MKYSLNKRARYLILISSLLSASPIIAQSEVPDSLSVPGYEQLDELVIEADKPILKTDGAKLTYDVEEDPSADSSSAMDILKKVPQISVDGDGNVRLNGSTAFKFQVNGIDNPMLKQYADRILPAMPGSMISKIEVITEPGAKEDAEGVAGIINIITERTQSKDGYSGSVSLKGDNRSISPSLNAILKKNKVTLSANASYQWGFSPQKGENEMSSLYLSDPSLSILKTNMRQDAKHQFASGNISMSWEPNARNLVTTGIELFYLDVNMNSIKGETNMMNNYNNSMWSFKQTGYGSLGIFNLSANASYRHNFELESKNYLVISYLFNFGRNNLWIDRTYYDMINYLPANGYASQKDSSKTFNRGHTVQADYANDFRSEHHLLEVGVKGIFRDNSAESKYYYGENIEAMTESYGELIDQPQDIYAAYGSYTGNFGNFGIVGGLRFEHTRMGVKYKYATNENFNSHLNDWVPNAALTWNFSPASNLRLAYQMRISRPSIDQVNPFELSFTEYEIRRGNPDLTSERNHMISLKYSAFGRILGGSIGLEYNLSDNAISGYTYLEQGEINTVVTTYANIGKKQDVALTGFFNWNIIKNMNFALNGRLAYNKFSAPKEGYWNHGWSGNIGGMWNYAVADLYKFAAYGAWFAPNINLQGNTSGFYYYGISASRDFLKNKSLNLSISANNFMQSKMKYKMKTSSKDVVYNTTAYNLSAWTVGISLTWKFGSLTDQVKKTGREIMNDDINTSSNKGQGSTL